jgi:outer membrane protein
VAQISRKKWHRISKCATHKKMTAAGCLAQKRHLPNFNGALHVFLPRWSVSRVVVPRGRTVFFHFIIFYMFNKTLCLLAAILTLSSASVSAQTPTKFGHMNIGNLLEQLPETKTANDALTAYATTFQAKDDSLGKAFEVVAGEFQRKYEAGEYTQVQAQQRYQEIQKMQADIEAFERDAEAAVGKKRDELLTPLLTRVTDAIKAVGKENGYAMIFDVSSGVALYAAETEDVTPLVKKKLGIQ